MHLSQKELFLQHQAQTSKFPLMLEMDHASGIYIYDKMGKKHLDLISGIGVSNIGHGNEYVKNAIKQQVDKHMHLMVYGEFIQSPQVQLARKLASLLPERLNCSYFVNSGAEATDGSLKLAKRVTGRMEIIALKHAYHGSTHAALSLNSDSYYKNPFLPLLPGIKFIDHDRFDHLDEINEETACVIIETVMGEAGYLTHSKGYLKAVRKKCDEQGALLILDEIQCGIGRTGKMFAFGKSTWRRVAVRGFCFFNETHEYIH